MEEIIQNPIDYIDVINLGFKRSDETDDIFFNTYGFEWFLVTKKLKKGVAIDWDCNTHYCKLEKFDEENGSILETKEIIDLNHLNEIIELYKLFFKK